MRRLRLVTYLGANTAPIASDIAASLGWDVAGDGTLGPIERQHADVYWMCGLLTVELIDSGRLDAEIVAAPVFTGQTGPVYHSVIIATSPADHVGELTGRRLVINQEGSWSGNHALRAHLQGSAVSFASVTESGAHTRSVDMLLAGEGDVTAIDHTIWEHLLAHNPAAGSLFVVGRTQDWPAPPFSVSRRLDDVDAVRRVLVRTAPVGLESIVEAASTDYDPIRAAVR